MTLIEKTWQNNTNITCYGDTNGVTVLNISGGDGNYTLSAFGQTLPLLGSNTISSSQFFPGGIPAGVYPGGNRIPVLIDWTDVLITTAASFLICVLVTLYPSTKASLLNPVDPLRYE